MSAEVTGTQQATPNEPVEPKQEGQTPSQATPKAGESGTNAMSEAAKEVMRKHKLKVDGQEIEVDEEELKRRYIHQRTANKILQEGKMAKKQAEEFISMMKDKQKLFDVIKKLGHDPRNLAEEYLAAQLEDELLDPREKELKEAKNKLKAYEEMEKQQREAIEKKRDDDLKAKYAKDYTEQFATALKESSLPQTKQMIAEMAKYIHRAAAMKFEMTPKEAAQLVKEDIENSFKNLYSESDPETIARLLGDQGLQKIRSYDVAKLKSPEANLKTPKEQAEHQRERSGSKRFTTSEWSKFKRSNYKN